MIASCAASDVPGETVVLMEIEPWSMFGKNSTGTAPSGTSAMPPTSTANGGHQRRPAVLDAPLEQAEVRVL